jgi:hypothetical protein
MLNSTSNNVTINTAIFKAAKRRRRCKQIRAAKQMRKRQQIRAARRRMAMLIMLVFIMICSVITAINVIAQDTEEIHVVENPENLIVEELEIEEQNNIITLEHMNIQQEINSATNSDKEEKHETAEIVEETVNKPSQVSEEVFETLCCLTYAEGGIEEYVAQVAIASVILNRMESDDFPNTLSGVMNYLNAFSSVKNGRIYVGKTEVKFKDVPETTKQAVRAALNGEDPTEELLRQEAIRRGVNPEKYADGGAVYFYKESLCSKKAIADRSAIVVKVEIGTQYFYKYWDIA